MLSLMGSYPIMGNPAWSPVMSPLGVPTLMNGPGNGPLAENRSNMRVRHETVRWCATMRATDVIGGLKRQIWFAEDNGYSGATTAN